MKIIVTGGAGFIGSHLVDKLVEYSHDVIVLDNLKTGQLKNISNIQNKISFIKCDLSKKEDNWEKYFKNVDIVFHLAGLADIIPSIENPDLYYYANVQSTFNVMEASRKFHIKKVIYSASSSCYGIPNMYPTKESHTINPQYPYALTKYLGEKIVMHWGSVYKIPTISLRLFNVYGLRSRTSGTYGAVFGVFLAQKIAKKPFTVVGDGTQSRDFTFVDDVVKALYFAANSEIINEIINIGSGKTYSINYLVELLQGDTEFIPKRPGEPNCTHADISKAKELLNWSPQVNFQDGVKLLLQNINYWRESPLWDKQSIGQETKKWFELLN